MHAQPVLVSTLKFDELLVSSWRDWREGVYAGTGSSESHQDGLSLGLESCTYYNITISYWMIIVAHKNRSDGFSNLKVLH